MPACVPEPRGLSALESEPRRALRVGFEVVGGNSSQSDQTATYSSYNMIYCLKSACVCAKCVCLLVLVQVLLLVLALVLVLVLMSVQVHVLVLTQVLVQVCV